MTSPPSGPHQAIAENLATELIVDEPELARVRCRHEDCNDPPIGIYHVPAGCFCFDDPIQALCQQHFAKAENKGPMVALIRREKVTP